MLAMGVAVKSVISGQADVKVQEVTEAEFDMCSV